MRAHDEASVADQLHAIASSWNPICAVTLTIDPTVAHRLHRDTVRVVEEAIGNAYRHGAAGRIDVSIGRVEDGIEVRVVDDGSGPGGGAPGLGLRSAGARHPRPIRIGRGARRRAELIARLPAEG